MSSARQLRMTVYAALLGALTAAGAYMAIPIGPVPIVLQNYFIFLSGLLLGRKWGAISVAAYLLAGLLGLPVFAGGTGGIGRFAGPTGGYLVGFLPAVYVIGWLSAKRPGRLPVQVVAMICGAGVIYACGGAWLCLVTGMSPAQSLAVGVYPFLPGDALKIAAALPVAKALRPIVGK